MTPKAQIFNDLRFFYCPNILIWRLHRADHRGQSLTFIKIKKPGTLNVTRCFDHFDVIK